MNLLNENNNWISQDTDKSALNFPTLNAQRNIHIISHTSAEYDHHEVSSGHFQGLSCAAEAGLPDPQSIWADGQDPHQEQEEQQWNPDTY